MDCSESGDGMKKVSKPHEDLGESSVNKTHTKPKTTKKGKRVGASADNNKTERKTKKMKKRKSIAIFGRGPLLYKNGELFRFDFGKTMTLIMKSADFALEVYNKTHSLAFSLMELVRATGDDSRLDLLFRAKPIDPSWRRREDPDPKIFRARVFVTLDYVEFVRPDDMTCYS